MTKYATEDDVREERVEGKTHPRLRRRRDTDPPGTQYRKRFKQTSTHKWFGITAGSLMVYLGIELYAAAMQLRSTNMCWQEGYGFDFSLVRNAMTEKAYKQHRRFLVFCDRERQVNYGQPGFRRLYPVEYLIEHFRGRWKSNWTMGSRMAVDEAMILYSGKKIDFVQYMPAKPIKHGVKVYALCCADTGYCFAFEIYEGSSTLSNKPEDIIDRLLEQSGFIAEFFSDSARGRTMFTDNWYTSPKLAAHLAGKYKMSLIGTYRLTKKKSRDGSDFPFGKMAPAATKLLPRGWGRKAVAPLREVVPNEEEYPGIPVGTMVEATVWKDKKLVALLNTVATSGTDRCTVDRYSKQLRKVITINCFPSQILYKDNMNGVDVMDRDISDNGVKVKAKQWATNVAFWLLNVNCANDWRLVTYWSHDVAAQCFKEFVRNKKRSGNRHRFNMLKAMAMIRLGIERDWTDRASGGPRPTWMRQKQWIPCSCKRCFFCTVGLTNGKQHVPRQSRKRVSAVALKVRCVQMTRIDELESDAGSDVMGRKCSECYISKRAKVPSQTSSPGRKTKAKRNNSVWRCDGCKKGFCGPCKERHLSAAAAAEDLQ